MLIKDNKYTVDIEDLGHSGEGVAKIDGFTIFVAQGVPGDIVEIKITLLKKNYALGKIIKIIKASDSRVKPLCPLANTCGGCQVMHIDYKHQLKMKEKRVKDTLERIGKINTELLPIIGMENPYKYRNKAQMPVGVLDGKAILGFFKKGTHDIVDTDYCYIQAPINSEIIKLVKQYIESYKISVYDEKTGKGLLRHLVTKVAFKTGEIMVVLVTKSKKLAHTEQLVEMLLREVKGIKSIVQNINEKNTNVIMGDENIVLYGENKIVDYIGNLKFNISAQSFFQVNPVQTEILYKKALEYAELKGEERVIDIYCGIGTISLFLAQKAKKVVGVEIVESAIKDARENARINNINNAEFYTGRAEEVIPKLYENGFYAHVVVVDPPRKGCDEKVLETIVKMKPRRVVYVSCNPATLGRDLAYLEERGYKTVKVQPVDMFPHSAHVECIALIQREIS